MVYGKSFQGAIRLLSLVNLQPKDANCCLQKQKQQQDANADAAAGTKRKKVTAAQLRVQKGMSTTALCDICAAGDARASRQWANYGV